MKYHVDWLKGLYFNEAPFKYLFFWGHQPHPDGRISESCFSQWWEGHPFIYEGVTYLTAEHWMMAGKARLFHDETALNAILQCKSPAEAKDLGRTVLNFDPVLWDKEKYELVKKGNYLKFSQHKDLNTFLKKTELRILVEARPVDRIWGVGMAKNDPGIENPAQWKGENLLGFALMEVRDEV